MLRELLYLASCARLALRWRRVQEARDLLMQQPGVLAVRVLPSGNPLTDARLVVTMVDHGAHGTKDVSFGIRPMGGPT